MSQSQIPVSPEPPSFAPWSEFSVEQLEAILCGWLGILANAGWTAWHGHAEQAIAEIESEMEQRWSDDGFSSLQENRHA
jgi:hypothetical protein